MFARFAPLVAAAILSLGGAASAATINATSVTTFQGAGVKGDRGNGANALGAADGKFLSLGLGGAAVFSFGQAFVGPASFLEVTFGKRAGYVERAVIYVGNVFTAGSTTFDASAFTRVGEISNATEAASLSFDGAYRFLAMVDTSPRKKGRDGYDIDAITVTAAPVAATLSAVPLPASAFFLLGGLGVLGMARRRRFAR